jgi:hypothetical protein
VAFETGDDEDWGPEEQAGETESTEEKGVYCADNETPVEGSAGDVF